MHSDSCSEWTFLVAVTTLLLSGLVVAQILTRYGRAYLSAPCEVQSLLEAIDFSFAANESLEQDMTRVSRLEDKLRLVQLLRDMQQKGDDLREDVNAALDLTAGACEHPPRQTLKTTARVMWADKRVELEDKLRRLDMLRMRFLVVHLGIMAAAAVEKQQQQPIQEQQRSDASPRGRDPEKTRYYPPRAAAGRHMARPLSESSKATPPLRRLTTQAIGHPDQVEVGPKNGWAGVVSEMKKSPMMQRRRQSIDQAVDRARPRLSP